MMDDDGRDEDDMAYAESRHQLGSAANAIGMNKLAAHPSCAELCFFLRASTLAWRDRDLCAPLHWRLSAMA